MITALLLGGFSLRGEIQVLTNFTLWFGPIAHRERRHGCRCRPHRMAWVGAMAQLTAPPGAQTVDLSGKYVTPGIINLHRHLGNTVGLTQNAKFFTRENVAKNLALYASYGVTSMLSLCTDQDLIFEIRDRQLRHNFDSVRTGDQTIAPGNCRHRKVTECLQRITKLKLCRSSGNENLELVIMET